MEEKLRAIKKDLHLIEEPLQLEIQKHLTAMYEMVESIRLNIDKLEDIKPKTPTFLFKMAEKGVLAQLKTLDTTIGFCIKLAN